MSKKLLLLMLLSLSALTSCHSQKKLMKNIVAEYTFPTHTLSLDSLELSYIKTGNGTQTLLFIHGLSSNAEAWSKNIEQLQKHYTCVALDLPGFGKSSKLQVSYTPSYYAAVIYEFIQQLGLDKVVLIGHSMGGQAAIKLALSHPALIEKLVLVAPAGLERFSEASAKMMKAGYTAAVVKNTTEAQIEANYALNFYAVPAEASKMISDRKNIVNATDFDAHCDAIVKSIAGMLDEPVYDFLKELRPPTLVIFGEQDQLIPNRYFNPTLSTKQVAEVAQELIKNVQVEFIGESGHFVQFEKPKEVNLMIEQFVEK